MIELKLNKQSQTKIDVLTLIQTGGVKDSQLK